MIKGKRGQFIFSQFILFMTFLVLACVVGLIAGILYYDMNILEQTMKTVDFTLPIQNNDTVAYTNISHFQDILQITLYPILGLRSSLTYLTYFLLFGVIIALGLAAYLSSKNPIFFVAHVLFTLIITYFTFIMSNMYMKLLANPFINQLMIPFPIYNKIMMYLPQIIFFTSLIFGIIAFISLVKPTSNTYGNQTSLNYGGDY